MLAQKSWSATERKIGMLHACDQSLQEVIHCSFRIYHYSIYENMGALLQPTL